MNRITKTVYNPLTINKGKTKEMLLKSESELRLYARRRRIAPSTLCRILLDGKSAYPYQAREKSVFQKVLRKLLADGYLVQDDSAQRLDAAA